MRILMLFLVACKGGEPLIDTDTDPVETDLPPVLPGTTLIANIDPAATIPICEMLEAVEQVVLPCDGYDLVYGASVPSCLSGLPAVGPGCTATLDDLLDCADRIGTATCATDFSVDPCRALYAPACNPAGTIATQLLGGPYGLQDSLPLGALTGSQVYAFCLESSGFQPTTVTCDGQQITIEPSSQADCTDQLGSIPAACPTPLGASRACLNAVLNGNCEALFGGGPCAGLTDPACEPQ